MEACDIQLFDRRLHNATAAAVQSAQLRDDHDAFHRLIHDIPRQSDAVPRRPLRIVLPFHRLFQYRPVNTQSAEKETQVNQLGNPVRSVPADNVLFSYRRSLTFPHSRFPVPFDRPDEHITEFGPRMCPFFSPDSSRFSIRASQQRRMRRFSLRPWFGCSFSISSFSHCRCRRRCGRSGRRQVCANRSRARQAFADRK